MRIPQCTPLKRTSLLHKSFGGLEHTVSPSPSGFYDMLNLTGDGAPTLQVRKKRAFFREGNGVTGGNMGRRTVQNGTITAAGNVNDRLCYCTGQDIYFRGNLLTGCDFLSGVTNRTVLAIGRDAFILPDGKYVTENSLGLPKIIHTSYTFGPDGVNISVCTENGEALHIDYFGDTEPDNPSEDALWLKKEEDDSYSAYIYTNGEWVFYQTAKLMISGTGVGHKPQQSDTVSIEGLQGSALKAKVLSVATGYVILDCPILQSYLGSKRISFSKSFPYFDYSAEHLGRVWGCRYGLNENGEFLNEIYASKLNEPTRFDAFNGISTDSFCASPGCNGEFTGIGKLGSDLLFFKENYIIRISGSTPSEFYISVIPAPGVAKGAYRSIVNLNGKLYYQSDNGIYVFDGSLPYCISDNLGNEGYQPGFAAEGNGKYYICMKNAQGTPYIYVFHPDLGRWYKEDDDDNTQFFVKLSGGLYGIALPQSEQTQESHVYSFYIVNRENAVQGSIFSDTPGQPGEYTYVEEENVSWFAQSGRLSIDSSGTQLLRSAVFYLEKPQYSTFSVGFATGHTTFTELCSISDSLVGSMAVPVRTPRCTSFYIKTSGTGECTLFSRRLIFENTGEVKGIEQ